MLILIFTLNLNCKPYQHICNSAKLHIPVMRFKTKRALVPVSSCYDTHCKVFYSPYKNTEGPVPFSCFPLSSPGLTFPRPVELVLTSHIIFIHLSPTCSSGSLCRTNPPHSSWNTPCYGDVKGVVGLPLQWGTSGNEPVIIKWAG